MGSFPEQDAILSYCGKAGLTITPVYHPELLGFAGYSERKGPRAAWHFWSTLRHPAGLRTIGIVASRQHASESLPSSETSTYSSDNIMLSNPACLFVNCSCKKGINYRPGERLTVDRLQLRSKRELIEKFIDECMPNLVADAVVEEEFAAQIIYERIVIKLKDLVHTFDDGMGDLGAFY